MTWYPGNWATLSRDVKRSRLKNGRVQCSCCGDWFPWEHIEVHHTSYRGDADRAGVNLFPVCGSTQEPGSCHHSLHFSGGWNQYDDELLNHNDAHVVDRLRRGYATGNPDGVPWLAIGIASVIAVAALAFATQTVKPKKQATIFAPSYEVVNVRNGKGKVVGTLPNGTEVDVGICEAGYCTIGSDRWVYKRYLVEDGK